VKGSALLPNGETWVCTWHSAHDDSVSLTYWGDSSGFLFVQNRCWHVVVWMSTHTHTHTQQVWSAIVSWP